MTRSGENTLLRRADWRSGLLISALVAVLLLYFWPLLWTDKYIYGELDIRRSLYLFKKVAYELMQGGDMPLWIPYLYCGMPLLGGFLATPFYPLDLVFMLARVPLNMAFNWDLLIHLVVAQVFSFLFFKRLFARRMVAVFCSMWFWNVFFLGSIVIGDALNLRAMLLVPAVFYFTQAGLGEGSRPRHFLFGSLVLSLQMLCGGLQFTFYTTVAVTAYAAFLLVARARRKDRVFAPMLGFGIFIIVALAMASVQLLPAWEYSRLSVRATGVSWFRIWALQPYQLIDYVIPMFEGEGRGHGYFGIVTVVLAAYSLPFWKDRRKYFFLALATVSLVYSLGGNTLLSSWLAGLPLVRDFRGPFRGAIMFNLSAFVLAGGALSSFLHSNSNGASRHKYAGFVIVGILLVGGFIAAASLASDYPAVKAAKVAQPAAFMALSVLAVFLLLFSSRFKSIGGLVLVALLAGDLALNYGGFYSPTPTRIFEKDWTVRLLEEENGSSRIAVYNTAHSNYFGLFGIEAANGHHPFPLARYGRFLPLLNNPKIASLAGVKHSVFYASSKDNHPCNPPVLNSDEASVVPSPLTPLPRAFLVTKYRVLPAEQIPDAMTSPEFEPYREVILEKAPSGFRQSADLQVEGSAIINLRRANEISVETMCEREAILVLCDSFYPGWKAEVDGERAELLTADYVFRAVPLSGGKHTVVFRFKPVSFVLGSLISCTGIVVWFLWAFFVFWKKKVRLSGGIEEPGVE